MTDWSKNAVQLAQMVAELARTTQQMNDNITRPAGECCPFHQAMMLRSQQPYIIHEEP